MPNKHIPNLTQPLIKVNGHGSTHVRVWDYRTKARPSYSTAATHIPRSCMSRLDMYEWVSNQVTISDLFYDSAFLTSVSLWLLEDVLLTVDFWDNEDTWDTRHCRLLIWPGPDSGAGLGRQPSHGSWRGRFERRVSDRFHIPDDIFTRKTGSDSGWGFCVRWLCHINISVARPRPDPVLVSETHR